MLGAHREICAEISAMKAFLAACIAIGILSAIDLQFNDGRHVNVVKRAVSNLVPR